MGAVATQTFEVFRNLEGLPFFGNPAAARRGSWSRIYRDWFATFAGAVAPPSGARSGYPCGPGQPTAAGLPPLALPKNQSSERWDAAFPQSWVFVHRFEDNHSYVMRGTSGKFSLGVGDAFEDGHEGDLRDVFSSFTHMDVVAIDDNTQVATIHLIHRPGLVVPPVGPGILLGGVTRGGEGIIILPGGGIKPVPPHSPAFKVLEQVALYLDSESINSIQIRNAVRQEALSTISALAQDQIQTMSDSRQPAPLARQGTMAETDK